MPTKVIITGASGVLGSAVRSAFTSSPEFEVLALSFTQKKDGLVPLDLQDKDLVQKTFQEFNPDWVIHCAAERRPDVAQKDPEAARRLNADVPAHLASLSSEINYKLVYISTDYVFDGTSPPYSPSSTPNPVNLYGITKLAGEQAVSSSSSSSTIILRVPVLYGPAAKNSDTAINILLDVVLDQSGKQYKMDHFATRYPTNVIDIAAFLVRLTSLSKSLPKIIHYSAEEVFTKYEICLIFAKILGLEHGHIVPDSEEPKGEAAVGRPRDCQLDISETKTLVGESTLGSVGFEDWWTKHLKK